MDKDESVDRLLRRSARAQENARIADACLDAETLAALVDGSLTATERTAAETHAADCDRCLSVLAAIAKTAPPPSAPEPTSWFSVRWLVPLTSAAVAITAWVVIQGPQRPQSEGSQSPQSEQRPQSDEAPQSARAAEEARKADAAGTQGPESTGTAKPAEPHQGARATQEAKAGRLERDATASLQDTLSKNEIVAPPAARSRDQAAETRSSRTAAPRVDEIQSLPGRAVEMRSPPPPPAAAAPAARPLAETLDERLGLQAAQIASTVITSPDPRVRWRLAGTTVARSIDSGQTWTQQTTGTTADLRAGAAPSADVCWIVGPSGVVLLSTDGRTWRRLEFPDRTADLVAVTALDAATATVTAADGRTYRTSDGGRTWTLQETPAAPF